MQIQATNKRLEFLRNRIGAILVWPMIDGKDKQRVSGRMTHYFRATLALGSVVLK